MEYANQRMMPSAHLETLEPKNIKSISGDTEKIGILLSNLGTPEAPNSKSLRKYLRQFLSDQRVIEFNTPLKRGLWWLLLNTIILTFRPKQSAKKYASIWTKAGSPLFFITKAQQRCLSQYIKKEAPMLADRTEIEVGMRYGEPSIPNALKNLRQKGCSQILLLPLYPQYSATTTASSLDEAYRELMSWRSLPNLRTVMQYHTHPRYIDALVHRIRTSWETGIRQSNQGRPDKLVFSFHGLPQRYVDNGDPYQRQCYETVALVVKKLKLEKEDYLVTFQSRFGREPWIEPATDESLESLAKSGVRSVDVVCPGFSADCLETLEEINMENREIFLEAGGKNYRYIPALNASPKHIEALFEITRANTLDWLPCNSFQTD